MGSAALSLYFAFIAAAAGLRLEAEMTLFPPPSVIQSQLDFNYAYGEYAQSQRAIDLPNWWAWEQAVVENDTLWNCWHALGVARDPDLSLHCRLRHACELRRRIGPGNYAWGRMPPCVPIWRFRSLD